MSVQESEHVRAGNRHGEEQTQCWFKQTVPDRISSRDGSEWMQYIGVKSEMDEQRGKLPRTVRNRLLRGWEIVAPVGGPLSGHCELGGKIVPFGFVSV